jgi:hypothetical protein
LGNFIERLLSSDFADRRPLLETGLALLDRESATRHAGSSIAAITALDQDALLADLLAGKTMLSWTVSAQDFARPSRDICVQIIFYVATLVW